MNMLKIFRSSGTLRMLGFNSVSTHIMFLTELSRIIGIVYTGSIHISIKLLTKLSRLIRIDFAGSFPISIKFLTELSRKGQNVGRMLIMKIYGSPVRDDIRLYQTTAI